MIASRQRSQETVGLGCCLLVLLFAACVVCLVIGALLGVQLDFGGKIVEWWRDVFGEPIFRLLVIAVITTKGDVMSALALIGFGTWLVGRILWIPTLWGLSSSGRLGVVSSQATTTQSIHDKLRRMFVDDLEKVAFYESRLASDKADFSARRAYFSALGGCLFSLAWSILSFLISILIGVAIFNGVLRLFGGMNTPQQLLASAGTLAPELAPFLPLPTTVNGINLNEKSLLLVSVVGLLIFLDWFLRNVSVSGWTRPAGVPYGTWAGFGAGLVLSFILLNGLFLLLASWYFFFDLCAVILGKFIWRGIYLRGRSLIRRWTELHYSNKSTQAHARET